MNTKTTLLLLLLVGALVAGVLVFQKKIPRSWKAGDLRMLVFDARRVEGIQITSNEDQILLRRQGRQWRLESPVRDQADPQLVQRILTLCAELEREPVADAGAEKQKAFGLASPAVRIKLLGPEMPPELLLGRETAV